jgi:hypothetical protein
MMIGAAPDLLSREVYMLLMTPRSIDTSDAQDFSCATVTNSLAYETTKPLSLAAAAASAHIE